MSRGQRRRVRVDVGSRVMICADSMPDILADMALVDKDDNILKGVQMFGTVKSKTVNHFAVELPAAEETIQFLKEKVTCVESKKKVPVMYVLHDNNIKTLEGLQLPPGFVPKDYFPSFDEANESARISLQKANVSAVQNSATTPGIIAPVFNSVSSPVNTE